jgi:hypothetical protein
MKIRVLSLGFGCRYMSPLRAKKPIHRRAGLLQEQRLQCRHLIPVRVALVHLLF